MNVSLCVFGTIDCSIGCDIGCVNGCGIGLDIGCVTVCSIEQNFMECIWIWNDALQFNYRNLILV